MDTVRLAGRTVNRLGISLQALRATGMWGEPTAREEAVQVIRTAVRMGAGVLEVPLPFGPAADLVRQAGVPEACIVARLTQPVRGLAVLRSRLGRLPDVVLAEPDLLHEAAGWGLPSGVVGGEVREGLAAVRGPYPEPEGVIRWCEAVAIPYVATEPAVLRAGRHTIAVPAVRSVTEVERLFGEEGTTPPAGGPG